MAAMNSIILVDGSRVDVSKLIGSGSDGFVIRHGDNNQVLKIPRLFGRSQGNGIVVEADGDNDLHLEHLEAEKEIYERLRGVPGIANCIECTSNGILLEYYPKGSLGDRISRGDLPPAMAQRWNWALQATDCIARCHENRVLVFDIALRNFLLTEELELRMIGFANSSLLPLDANVLEADVDGGTVKVDILHLANVVYSISSWKEFACRCEEEAEWASLDRMPDVSGMDCGQVISDCWSRKYDFVQKLALELRKGAGRYL